MPEVLPLVPDDQLPFGGRHGGGQPDHRPQHAQHKRGFNAVGKPDVFLQRDRAHQLPPQPQPADNAIHQHPAGAGHPQPCQQRDGSFQRVGAQLFFAL